MSGDNQTKQRRKAKRKQKQDEPPVAVDNAKPKDKKIKQKKVESKDEKPKAEAKIQDQGTSWVSKIEILILVVIVSGLVALVAIEYREDLESRFSQSGLPEYLKGWIEQPAKENKFDEPSFKIETTDQQEDIIVDILNKANDSVTTDKHESDNEAPADFSTEESEAAVVGETVSEIINKQPDNQEEEDVNFADEDADAESLNVHEDDSESDIKLKGSDLKNQVDELVDVYNEIAQMLGKENSFKEPQIPNHAEANADSPEMNDEPENTDDNSSQQQEDLQEHELSEESPAYQKEETTEFPSRGDIEVTELDFEESDAAENLDHYPELKLLYEHAKRLDVKAEKERSNAILTEALAAYQDLLFNRGHKLNDTIFREIADRSIERMRFVGKLKAAVAVHKKLIERFDDEVDHRTQLAITYLLGNHLSVAKLVLHETLTRWPSNGLALVHYGFVLKQLDQDFQNAVVYLKEGIATFEPGTQDGRFYFNLGDALQRLGRADEARQVYRKGADMGLFLSEYQRSLYNVDRLESRPFWTKVQTTYKDDLMEIQKYWQLIRDEGLKLLTKDGTFTNEAENLKDTGDWKQFELYARGVKSKHCSMAPITCKIIEKFTAAATCKRGQVKFSVLHPNTHVHPHCGPTNCRIRCHLGLKVPEKTFIRVGETTKSWAEGEWLIFDDSFEHEVWHNGTGTRLVLIVDVWHPDLTEDERESLSGI